MSPSIYNPWSCISAIFRARLSHTCSPGTITISFARNPRKEFGKSMDYCSSISHLRFAIGGIYMMNSMAKISSTSSVAKPSYTSTPIKTLFPLPLVCLALQAPALFPIYRAICRFTIHESIQHGTDTAECPIKIEVIAILFWLMTRKLRLECQWSNRGTYELDRPMEGYYSISVKIKPPVKASSVSTVLILQVHQT